MIDKVFQIDIAASIQRVWDELTRRGVPHHPMFGTYLHADLTPGSVMSYRDKSGAHTFVLGEVLELSPPTRLVHTFMFSMEKDAPTLVEWELREVDGKTRVTVTHSRFEGETRTYKSVATSWPKILALYKSVIETGSVPLGTRALNGMMMSMTFMLPASAKTVAALARPLKAPSAGV